MVACVKAMVLGILQPSRVSIVALLFPCLPVWQLLHAGHPWDCVLWEANLLRRSLELFLENWLRRVWRGCARQYVQVRSQDFEFSLKSPSKVSLVQWTERVPGVPLLHFWGALWQAYSLLSSQVSCFNMTVLACQVPAVVSFCSNVHVVQGGAIWLPERPLEQGGHSEIHQVQHCRQVGKLQQ